MRAPCFLDTIICSYKPFLAPVFEQVDQQVSLEVIVVRKWSRLLAPKYMKSLPLTPGTYSSFPYVSH